MSSRSLKRQESKLLQNSILQDAGFATAVSPSPSPTVINPVSLTSIGSNRELLSRQNSLSRRSSVSSLRQGSQRQLSRQNSRALTETQSAKRIYDADTRVSEQLVDRELRSLGRLSRQGSILDMSLLQYQKNVIAPLAEEWKDCLDCNNIMTGEPIEHKLETFLRDLTDNRMTDTKTILQETRS